MSRAWLHALVLVVGGCSCGDSGGFCGGDWDLFGDECASDADCLASEECVGFLGNSCVPRDPGCDSASGCECDESCDSEGECVPKTEEDDSCTEPPACLPAGAFCADDAACCNARCISHVCTDKVECAAGGESCSVNETCCSGACDEGVCATPKCTPGRGPEVLADVGEALFLAQSEEHLYWIDAGEVRSVPKRGGPVQTLAVGAWGESLARFETTLAWSSAADEIWTLTDPDVGPALFTQSPTPVWMVAANAQGVFWIGHGADFQDAVYGLPTGSEQLPAVLATIDNEQGYHALAIDETHVYFSDGLAIERVPILLGVASGPIETVRPGASDGGFGIDRIALDAEHVYFLDAGQMRAVPKAGGEEFAVSDAGGGYGVAVDAASVYWTANDGVAFSAEPYPILYRAPKLGGEAAVLVGTSGESAPGARSVVVDEACAYWLDPHGGNLMRITK